MKKIIILMFCCAMLSSCETLKEIQDAKIVDRVSSFQLNPVQANNYWYNGKSYEYNVYEIEITSSPGSADIQWNGKHIGVTPMVYRFTGVIDIDERLVMRAVPIGGKLPPQEAAMRVRTELPRKIHLNLNKNETENKK